MGAKLGERRKRDCRHVKPLNYTETLQYRTIQKKLLIWLQEHNNQSDF